jgi:hypothetical protein
LTILASLAQDESRSISENSKWGLRRRYENGEYGISTKRFMGYDRDINGKLIINHKQAKAVKRIYAEYLSGKTPDHIKRILRREKIPKWDGTFKWETSTIQSMLTNEKYKGDAELQKEYTVDFLSKKREKNNGQLQKFYIEDDHEAIISRNDWECVQLEMQRRREYMKEHGLKSYAKDAENNPLFGKIICGECGMVFGRKVWMKKEVQRKVWQCNERYKQKGVQGCINRHLEESTAKEVFVIAWNAIIENAEVLRAKWQILANDNNPLTAYKAKDFLKLTETATQIEEFDADLVLRVLDHITIHENGNIIVKFYDGTEIEYN